MHLLWFIQHHYYLRHFGEFRLPHQILKNFYTNTIESVLTGGITAWYGDSTQEDHKALPKVVKSAEHTTWSTLSNPQDIYTKRCRSRAKKITNHPNNGLFSVLLSGEHYCCLKAITERLWRSFFSTVLSQSICILNEDGTWGHMAPYSHG